MVFSKLLKFITRTSLFLLCFLVLEASAQDSDDGSISTKQDNTAGVSNLKSLVTIEKLEIQPPFGASHSAISWWEDYRSILSILAMLLSSSTLIYNMWSRREDKRQSIHDGFWLRKVIFPKITEPLQEFWLASKKAHTDVFGFSPSSSLLTQKNIDDYHLKIWSHFGDIKDSIQILSTVSNDLINQAETIIENYEEDVNDITVFPKNHAMNLHNNLIEFLKNEVHKNFH